MKVGSGRSLSLTTSDQGEGLSLPVGSPAMPQVVVTPRTRARRSRAERKKWCPNCGRLRRITGRVRLRCVECGGRVRTHPHKKKSPKEKRRVEKLEIVTQ